MDKSSKLITNNTFLMNSINFDAFGVSKNWIGYFEHHGAFDYSVIDTAIEIVKTFFNNHWENFFSISALSYSDDKETDDRMGSDYVDIYNNLKKMGYLRPYTKQLEDYLYGDIPLPASCLSIHFDSKYFFDISKLMMGHDGVIGQVVFFINLEIGVALYPHDDIGFGIISLNPDSDICNEFLKFVDKYNSIFKVVR